MSARSAFVSFVGLERFTVAIIEFRHGSYLVIELELLHRLNTMKFNEFMWFFFQECGWLITTRKYIIYCFYMVGLLGEWSMGMALLFEIIADTRPSVLISHFCFWLVWFHTCGCLPFPFSFNLVGFAQDGCGG